MERPRTASAGRGRRGSASIGWARYGTARQARRARFGKARRGPARSGTAKQGRQGMTNKLSNEEYKVLNALERRRNLDAESVLKEAKNKSSPIHHRFNWNDSQAAHAFRIDQARSLIRSFHLVVITPPREEKTFVVSVVQSDNAKSAGGPRAFIPVGKNGNTPMKYESRDRVLASPSDRLHHIERVLAQFQGMLSTNSDIEELDPIREVVDQVALDVRRKLGRIAV